jgi:hypothetical protein
MSVKQRSLVLILNKSIFLYVGIKSKEYIYIYNCGIFKLRQSLRPTFPYKLKEDGKGKGYFESGLRAWF